MFQKHLIYLIYISIYLWLKSYASLLLFLLQAYGCNALVYTTLKWRDIFFLLRFIFSFLATSVDKINQCCHNKNFIAVLALTNRWPVCLPIQVVCIHPFLFRAFSASIIRIRIVFQSAPKLSTAGWSCICTCILRTIRLCWTPYSSPQPAARGFFCKLK